MASLTPYQRDILIRTALGEARGQGVEGMADVIQVIMNRAASGKYPSDPARAALQDRQFSAWNEIGNGGNNPGQFRTSDPIYRQAEQALNAVLSGNRPDYTGGAWDYHAPSVTPYWASSKNQYGTIERNGHIYYPRHPVPPGSLPDTAVATLLDTQRRVPPSMPTPMPPELNAKRNLQTLTPTNDVYRGILSPTQRQAVTPAQIAAVPVSRAQTIATVPTTQRPQTYAGQDQYRPTPYAAGQTIATVPTRQSVPVSGTYAGQERGTPIVRQPVTAAQIAAVPYNSGTTIGTVPTPRPVNPIAAQRAEQLATRQPTPAFPVARPTVAQPTAAQVTAGTGFRVATPPAQVASLPKLQDRLPAGVYPTAPAVPANAVATALAVNPPAVTGFPAPRPTQAISGFPTTLAQRPGMPMAAPQVQAPVPFIPPSAPGQPATVQIIGANARLVTGFPTPLPAARPSFQTWMQANNAKQNARQGGIARNAKGQAGVR